jgi:predicted DNA-binding transcriptional regulator AlpA
MEKTKPLIDLKEAEEVFGKSRSRLYGLVACGAIPEAIILRMGARIYLRRAALEAWLRGEDHSEKKIK